MCVCARVRFRVLQEITSNELSASDMRDMVVKHDSCIESDLEIEKVW